MTYDPLFELPFDETEWEAVEPADLTEVPVEDDGLSEAGSFVPLVDESGTPSGYGDTQQIRVGVAVADTVTCYWNGVALGTISTALACPSYDELVFMAPNAEVLPDNVTAFRVSLDPVNGFFDASVYGGVFGTESRYVDYGMADWAYMLVAAGSFTGFEDPAFDDSDWNRGIAPFGTGGGTCPLMVNKATTVPATQELLVRRHVTFEVPYIPGTVTGEPAPGGPIEGLITNDQLDPTAPAIPTGLDLVSEYLIGPDEAFAVVIDATWSPSAAEDFSYYDLQLTPAIQTELRWTPPGGFSGVSVIQEAGGSVPTGSYALRVTGVGSESGETTSAKTTVDVLAGTQIVKVKVNQAIPGCSSYKVYFSTDVEPRYAQTIAAGVEVSLTVGVGPVYAKTYSDAISFINPQPLQSSANQIRISPVPGSTYYGARVQAVDKIGNASGWSVADYVLTAADPLAPDIPLGLSTTPGYRLVALKWTPLDIPDLMIYEVRYAPSLPGLGVPDPTGWVTLRSASPLVVVTGLEAGTPSGVVTNPVEPVEYVFQVRAIDRSNQVVTSAVDATPVDAALHPNAGWSNGAVVALISALAPKAYYRLADATGPIATAAVGFDATYVGSPTLDAVGLLAGDSEYGSVDLSGSGQRIDLPWAYPLSGQLVVGGNLTGLATSNVLTTATPHGLLVNDPVVLNTLTGGAGLLEDVVYWVTSVPTNNTLTLSATVGGATLDFTTNVTLGEIVRALSPFAGTDSWSFSAFVNIDTLDATPRYLLDSTFTSPTLQGVRVSLATGMLRVDRLLNGAVVDTATFTAPVVDALTHHIAATYDGTALTIYWDGASTGTGFTQDGAATTALVATTRTTRIGGGSGGNYFDGQMQDVALFDLALTPDDVSAIYFGRDVAPVRSTPSQIGSSDMAFNTLLASFIDTNEITADWIKGGELTIKSRLSPAQSTYLTVFKGDTVVGRWDETGLIVRDPVNKRKAVRFLSGKLWFTDQFVEDDAMSRYPRSVAAGDPADEDVYWTTAIDAQGINASAILFGMMPGGHNSIPNASFELVPFPTTAPVTTILNTATEFGSDVPTGNRVANTGLNTSTSGAALSMSLTAYAATFPTTPTQSVTLPFLSPTSTLYAPTVTGGAAAPTLKTVTLPLLTSTSALYPPTVTGGGAPVLVGKFISPLGLDTNPGTELSPWKTILKFMQTAAAGDTLYCRQGTYTGQPNADTLGKASGTAANPITIRNYPGEVPNFVSTAFYIDGGVSYWVLDGLTISGTVGGSSSHVWVGNGKSAVGATNTHHITIRNCTITKGAASATTEHCIYLSWKGDSITVEDCVITGVSPLPPQGNAAACIHVYHDPMPTNVLIQRNFIRNAPKGIILYSDVGTSATVTATILHNTFYGNEYHIDARHYASCVVRDNVGNVPTPSYEATGFSLYDPAPPEGMGGLGRMTQDHNYWNQALNANGTLPAGSPAINGAANGSDAGAFDYGGSSLKTVTLPLLAATNALYAPTVVGGVAGGYVQTVLADTPIAYWRLGETSGTVANSSTGTITADLFNTPTLNVTGLLAGDVNKAMTFARATSEYAYAEGNMPAGTSAGASVEGWAKFATLTAATYYPVARWFHITGADAEASLWYDVAGNCLEYMFVDTVGPQVVSSDAWTPTIGTTYHLVVTHDYVSKQVRFYVNGALLSVEDVSALGPANVHPTAGFATIARAGSDYFDGTIDEVAIYSYRLSTVQVGVHYAAGSGGLQIVTVPLLTSTSALYPPTVVGLTAGGTTYYMAPLTGVSPAGSDSNLGTIGSPWASIQKFINANPAPGSTLLLRGGNYVHSQGGHTGDGVGDLIGTASQPITIRNYPGETPIFPNMPGELIVFRGNTTANTISVNYVVLDGIQFPGGVPNNNAVLVIGNSGDAAETLYLVKNVTIRNCFFGLAPGLINTDHPTGLVHGCENITFEDCEFQGPGAGGAGGDGIVAYHYPAVLNLVVQRCIFHDWAWYPIQLWDEASGTPTATIQIKHCTFKNNTAAFDIDLRRHSTALVQDCVFDGPNTTASINDPTYSSLTTRVSNYFNQTLTASYGLTAGSAAINGASDGTDAGAVDYVATGPQTVTVPLLTSTSALYAPTVVALGAPQNVTVPLLATTSALYAPTVVDVGGSTPYRTLVLADSPIAYYRLGETSGLLTEDELTPFNEMDFLNTPTLGVTGLLTGDANKAVTWSRASLEHAAGGASMPAGSSVGVSIEGWVRFATLTAATRYPVARWFVNSPVAEAQFYYDVANNCLRYIYQDATTSRTVSSDAWTPSTATTYHLVVTHDSVAESVRFYVNGALLSVEDVTAFGVPVVHAANGFASIARAGSDYFDGTIDEVAIYKSVLAAARVLVHYNSGTGGGGGPITQTVTIPFLTSGDALYAPTLTQPTSYSASVIADSPTAYWRLEETSGTVVTSAVNSVTADLFNTPTLNVTGLITGTGKAMTFARASSEYGYTEGLMPMGNAAGASLEGWVRFTTLTAATRYAIARWWHTTPAAECALYYDVDQTALRYSFQDSVGVRTVNSDAWSPSTATTYHLVVTHDYATESVKFYINGSLHSTEDVTAFNAPIVHATAGYCTIARVGSDYLDGTLDELAVYKSVLSATRVLAHYTAGTT